RIRRFKVLPLEDVAKITIQVCRVLARAHHAGIVHRDIKPSNIFLLEADGEIFVKILDFGVAKLGADAASELTTTGVMVGTRVYTGRDQPRGATSVDRRAAFWRLAVVVYGAIAGDLPFKNDDGLGALCRAVEKGSFPPPSSRVPGPPAELDDWFERAFEPK